MKKLSNFEKYSIRVTHSVMSDVTPVTIQSNVMRMWLLLSCVQFAWRAPNLSPDMKANLRHLGDNIAKVILSAHPEAKMLVNSGWSTIMDVGKGEGLTPEEFRAAMREMGLKYDESEGGNDGR